MRVHVTRRLATCSRRATGLLLAMLLLVGGLALATASPADAAGETTDLVFLVDGSGSIDPTDWQIQKDGLATALEDRTAFPRNGSIAVAVVQFSFVLADPEAPRTRVEVPLTVLSNDTAVGTVTSQIQGMQQIAQETNPGDAIIAGTDLLLAGGESPASTDWTLCMTTDGETNSGEPLGTATAYAKQNNVDRYSVIAIEDPPFASGDDLRAHYGPHVFGGGSVTVARNSAEVANLVVGGCLGGPVQLRALEVNQSIQNWHNQVRLVAGKETGVRAFVQVPTGEDDQLVTGRLFGRRGGTALPESPLLAVSSSGAGAVVAQPGAQSRRGQLAQSLNFKLPRSWRSGTVQLEFEAGGAPVTCQEPSGAGSDPANNCVVTVTFQNETTPEIVLTSVRYQVSGQTRAPSASDMVERRERLESILPVPSLDYRMDSLDTVFTQKPTLPNVNLELVTKRTADIAMCSVNCTDPTTENARYHGMLEGQGAGLAASSNTVSSAFLEDQEGTRDIGFARNRVAHEYIHNLGRFHAVDDMLPPNPAGEKVGQCLETAPAGTPAHSPFATVGGQRRPVLGPLGSANDEIWGLDSRLVPGDPNQLAVVSPRQAFEIMSYCRDAGGPQGRWISRFTYDGINGTFGPPSGGGGGSDADFADSPDDFVLVRGLIDFDANVAELAPTLEITGNPPPPPDGDYRAQLLAADGTELAAVDFDPIVMDGDAPKPETPSDPPVGVMVVPILKPSSPVAAIAILHNGEPIGGVDASENAPTVNIVRPAGGETFTGPTVTFEWDASDADGDALFHTVLYSTDDGDRWDTLAVGLTDTSLTVPRSDLAASTTARLQVITSDGVNVDAAVSERFAVANNAPVVAAIDQPHNNAVFSSVQNVDFVGTGFDPEDGQLTGTSLTWSSDLDGVLGSGEELTVNAFDDLSAGTHEITLTATDSDGVSATDTVTIHVFRVAPLPPIEVDVDVKPLDIGPAPIDTNSRAGVPVAILTTDTFDATTVDPDTVCFGDADDPAGSGDCTEQHGRGHLEDVDRDGKPDLLLHFEANQTGIRPDDRLACLTGQTFDGRRIAGCDEIRAR